MRRPRATSRWTGARRATAAVFLGVLLLGAAPWFPWVRGTTSATTLADLVPVVDPLAALETVLATRAVTAEILVGSGLLLALAVVMGPVFCGWLCPLGLLLDLNARVRTRVGRGRTVRSPRASDLAWGRYAVLGVVAGLAAAGGLPLFQAWSPINLLVRGVVFSSTLGLAVVAAVVVLEWFWSRVWCRSLCPLGALYGLVGRWGRLRVRIDPDTAGRTRCGQCSRECPMGIRVMEDFVLAGRSWIDDPACTRCGSCADVCPRDVLRLGLRRRVPRGDGGRPVVTVKGAACDRAAGGGS